VAYTGLPGSGKSYGVVENVIAPALKAKRRVVTNIPMDVQAVESEGWPGTLEVVATDDVLAPGWFSAVPGGSVVVLDELWRVWPSGLKAVNVPEEQKSFLAEHRHRVGLDGFSMEIVYVTQDLGQIAAFARQLVDQTVRVVKLSAVGADKRYRVDFYQGAQTGQNPPESRRLRQTFGSYRPEVWRLYQSHTQSASGAAGTESRVDSRGSALRSWSIRWGLPLAAVMIFVGSWGGYSALRDPVGVLDRAPAPEPRRVAGQASSAGAAPLPVSASAGRAVPLVGWRVAGWMTWTNRPESARVVLVSDAGAVRVINPDDLGCRVVHGGEGLPARDLACDVDGDTATPWTGSSAARSLGWTGGEGTGADVARPAAGHSAPVPVRVGG